ncbi:hypothetical protein D3C71_1418900 [compost metagenome]
MQDRLGFDHPQLGEVLLERGLVVVVEQLRQPGLGHAKPTGEAGQGQRRVQMQPLARHQLGQGLQLNGGVGLGDPPVLIGLDRCPPRAQAEPDQNAYRQNEGEGQRADDIGRVSRRVVRDPDDPDAGQRAQQQRGGRRGQQPGAVAIHLHGGEQQIAQPGIVDARRDDVPPQLDIAGVGQQDIHRHGKHQQRGEVPPAVRVRPGSFPLAGAHQKVEAGADQETGGQSELENDQRNIRPEVEGHGFSRSHTHHQDQQ